MSTEEVAEQPPIAHGSGAYIRGKGAWLLGALLAYTVIILALMFFWSGDPPSFSPVKAAQRDATAKQREVVPGYVTVHTTIALAETLLHKSGGYFSNDIMPPGLIMDDVPEWEFGVLQQLRDMTLALRNDFSRSQTQSQDDQDLREAHPLFSFTNDRWILPSSESQYTLAIAHLRSYLDRLSDEDQTDAQFYARADNLASYLNLVEKQLGNFSQRLSASVGQVRLNTDLSDDPQARQSTPGHRLVVTRTPWMQIDNEFYEARGA